MKISKLANSPNGSNYALNSSKSRMFAHSASEYWNTYLDLSDKSSEAFDLWRFMYVGLPAAHMALELMIKAFATFYNSDYDPKSDRHRTSKIISNYAASIDIFQPIINDSEKMILIKILEQGWEGLRYAECGLEFEAKDNKILEEVMTPLIEEYKKISGLKTL